MQISRLYAVKRFLINVNFILLYPTQRVAEGIIFLTRQSVCQSVSQSASPVFLVSATPLKPLNRISWNSVVMKNILCRCAYLQEVLGVMPLFELLTKIKDTTQNRWSAQRHQNRSTEFHETLLVVMKDIMCIYAFLQEMLIWSL